MKVCLGIWAARSDSKGFFALAAWDSFCWIAAINKFLILGGKFLILGVNLLFCGEPWPLTPTSVMTFSCWKPSCSYLPPKSQHSGVCSKAHKLLIVAKYTEITFPHQNAATYNHSGGLMMGDCLARRFPCPAETAWGNLGWQDEITGAGAWPRACS